MRRSESDRASSTSDAAEWGGDAAPRRDVIWSTPACNVADTAKAAAITKTIPALVRMALAQAEALKNQMRTAFRGSNCHFGKLDGTPAEVTQKLIGVLILPDPDGPDLGTAALLMNSFACRPLLCPQEAGGLQLSPYAMAKEGRLAVDGIERLTVTDTKLNYLPPSAP